MLAIEEHNLWSHNIINSGGSETRLIKHLIGLDAHCPHASLARKIELRSFFCFRFYSLALINQHHAHTFYDQQVEEEHWLRLTSGEIAPITCRHSYAF